MVLRQVLVMLLISSFIASPLAMAEGFPASNLVCNTDLLPNLNSWEKLFYKDLYKSVRQAEFAAAKESELIKIRKKLLNKMRYYAKELGHQKFHSDVQIRSKAYKMELALRNSATPYDSLRVELLDFFDEFEIAYLVRPLFKERVKFLDEQIRFLEKAPKSVEWSKLAKELKGYGYYNDVIEFYMKNHSAAFDPAGYMVRTEGMPTLSKLFTEAQLAKMKTNSDLVKGFVKDYVLATFEKDLFVYEIFYAQNAKTYVELKKLQNKILKEGRSNDAVVNPQYEEFMKLLERENLIEFLETGITPHMDDRAIRNREVTEKVLEQLRRYDTPVGSPSPNTPGPGGNMGGGDDVFGNDPGLGLRNNPLDDFLDDNTSLYGYKNGNNDWMNGPQYEGLFNTGGYNGNSFMNNNSRYSPSPFGDQVKREAALRDWGAIKRRTEEIIDRTGLTVDDLNKYKYTLYGLGKKRVLRPKIADVEKELRSNPIYEHISLYNEYKIQRLAFNTQKIYESQVIPKLSLYLSKGVGKKNTTVGKATRAFLESLATSVTDLRQVNAYGGLIQDLLTAPDMPRLDKFAHLMQVCAMGNPQNKWSVLAFLKRYSGSFKYWEEMRETAAWIDLSRNIAAGDRELLDLLRNATGGRNTPPTAAEIKLIKKVTKNDQNSYYSIFMAAEKEAAGYKGSLDVFAELTFKKALRKSVIHNGTVLIFVVAAAAFGIDISGILEDAYNKTERRLLKYIEKHERYLELKNLEVRTEKENQQFEELSEEIVNELANMENEYIEHEELLKKKTKILEEHAKNQNNPGATGIGNDLDGPNPSTGNDPFGNDPLGNDPTSPTSNDPFGQ